MTQSKPKKFRFIDVAKCFETPPLPLDFVLPGLLAGTVGGLTSAGGSGKSTFIIQAAAAIADEVAGADLLRLGLERHGRAVVLAAEDPDNVLHHRLHALGTHLSPAQRAALSERLNIAPCVGEDVDLHDSEWFAAIEEQAQDARLLVIDTLTKFHSLDENQACDAKKIMSSMEKIAARTGCAILYLHHVNKDSAMNGKADQQQAARGSSVFVDNARWLAFVAGMTKAEAEKYGIDEADRSMYIRWNISKQNYGAPRGDSWLKRHEGGILKAVELNVVRKSIKNGGRKYD